jgi:phage terminase large subunit
MLKKIQAFPTQIEAITKLNDATTREVVFGGAKGGGKSYLGCIKFISSCLLYPGTRYFIARSELNDLRKHTIPSILEFFNKCGLQVENFAKYNGQDNYFQFHNGSRLDLLACKYLPSDPMFERFGSMQYTQGWIEEGGEVHHLAYTNLKLSIGRCLNDKYNLHYKLLVTCNPKKNWLYHEFYRPWRQGKLPADKAFIQSFCTDNTFNPTDYAATLDSIEDNITKQRLRYGIWEYDADTRCLIDFEKIADIFTNTFVAGGMRYISADIARAGKDKTTIGIWNGLRCEKIITLSKSMTTDTAKEINKLRLQYGIPLSNIIVDEDGVGGGVKDILNCKGFTGNGSAIKGNYINIRSECYYLLSKLINESKVFINQNNDEKLKALIIGELEQIKSRELDVEGKLAVIKKEDIREAISRSPDYADMLMMRIYFELRPVRGLSY